jgi:membrane-associated protease RseP (regulator of RpoE activity)
MKDANTWSWFRPAALLCAGGFGVLVAGCSSSKPEMKAAHQRGWIGGEYEVAGRYHGPFSPHPEVYGFPKALKKDYRSGLLITALATNTPAEIAGLRAGDLVLEANHETTPKLKDFWRVVDGSKPGTLLPVKVYRDGEMTECNVTVGRETYEHEGTFSLGLGFISDLDLWPNPGFSVFVVSFQPSKEPRTELGSAESVYLKSANGGKYQPVETDWNAWLVIFGGSSGKRILTQEVVPAQTAAAADGRRAGWVDVRENHQPKASINTEVFFSRN